MNVVLGVVALGAALLLAGCAGLLTGSAPPDLGLHSGLLKAPSKYAPTNNLQRARDRAAVIAKAIAEGLLERDLAAGRLRFTRRGMLLANEVLTELV